MKDGGLSRGEGFGKVILFGEHFVVYGVPAIASAIGIETTARVEPASGKKLLLNDEGKLKQQKEVIKRIAKVIGIDISRSPVKITLKGDLPLGGGIGSSAASCVAIARALSAYFGLNLSDDKINETAYEGEKLYHGTPSGIDNAAATYGGLIWFKRGTPNLIERIDIKEPVGIVIANTGLATRTSEAVAKVRRKKDKHPEKYNSLFRKAEELAYKARRALEVFDLKEAGSLMNENHRLLQEIEVSNKELDFLVDLARAEGALGAKLTGGGLGGNMVALTPGTGLQEKVAAAMERKGSKVIRTKIGGVGKLFQRFG